MALRAYYADPIESFLSRPEDEILGVLVQGGPHAVETSQRGAWLQQITLLKKVLPTYRGRGKVYFEYAVPRLGKRIDVVLLIEHALLVLEFKVGESSFTAAGRDQVWDYGLDLKNFHEPSHNITVAPVLLATHAPIATYSIGTTRHNDGLLLPIFATPQTLPRVIDEVLAFTRGAPLLRSDTWETGRYRPTPTIIEAAMALYGGHSVDEISRREADQVNLTRTSTAISDVIASSRSGSKKCICFVTGVPGAGKTLVGLDIATKHIDKHSELYSVFLSGNGPLVDILREALARDRVRREAEAGRKMGKGAARSEVKLFIQNVHNFRDDCLIDVARPPIEHVALFDEAQRAWNLEQTASFMRRKRGKAGFDQSEPEFLVSCLDRHSDWAVVVCLVGGGQEINTGEAGITEWIEAVLRRFPNWHVHISPRLTDSEYGAGNVLEALKQHQHVTFNQDLHLAVSMRSFRAEHVSSWVKHLLDLDKEEARRLLKEVSGKYPIAVTRRLDRAKRWLRDHARGSERYGIVVSSEAQRLKPHAIDIRVAIDPVQWFLHGKEDVRSSYYLEDVATEFQVQGLELDWGCVVWDADFRYSEAGWQHFSFVGDSWNNIRKPERQTYLKNAYRVLLTRARQGLIVVVPEGDEADPTRQSAYYDPTFDYLHQLGMEVI